MLSGGNKPTWRILASLLTSPSQLKPVTHTNIPAHCFPLLTTNVNKHHQRSLQLTYRYSCNQARNEIQNGIHDQNNHNGVVWPERLVCLCLLNDCVCECVFVSKYKLQTVKNRIGGKKVQKEADFTPLWGDFLFGSSIFYCIFSPRRFHFRSDWPIHIFWRGGEGISPLSQEEFPHPLYCEMP